MDNTSEQKTENQEKKKIVRGPRLNQKLKIMYLMKILLEETDEDHDLTLNEIVEKLKAYNVTAERKSLYSDIENLRTFGLDIIGMQYGKTYHYKVASRQFQLVELKLLVDAVQSSRFITEKKSDELIAKLESYASKYEAKKLARQVNVNGRVKTMNERIYYSVDKIHEALNEESQIKFQYFTWTADKKMELKHGGAYYSVSPWALCWDDEKYYLVGYDNREYKIKHFRVDKMADDSKQFMNFLGFTFDGKKIFLRKKTTSKYYYRMHRKAKAIARIGEYTKTGKHINKTKLYMTYSDRGNNSRHSNFFTYVDRAEKEFGMDEDIRCDLKNPMGKIKKALEKR